jgi:hypothetical protein
LITRVSILFRFLSFQVDEPVNKGDSFDAVVLDVDPIKAIVDVSGLTRLVKGALKAEKKASKAEKKGIGESCGFTLNVFSSFYQFGHDEVFLFV